MVQATAPSGAAVDTSSKGMHSCHVVLADMRLFHARFGIFIVARALICGDNSVIEERLHVGVFSVSTSHPHGNTVDGLPRASKTSLNAIRIQWLVETENSEAPALSNLL